jgi:putative endonuclease
MMMMSPFRRSLAAHLLLGQAGERLAIRLLEELGFEILCHNWRHGKLEIDIVARDGDTLCFIEVKTRHRPLFRPATSIGREKRRLLVRAAHRYLHALHDPAIGCRYDIIEVIRSGRRFTAIYHWPNAFDEPRRLRRWW